ncbi:hypothetical protein [Chitinimonas sp.]|uniref:hypothetical protein n=1 Tax=Chitinimonas sp. TaxID=1934313 RepID=UPI0035AFFE11
MRRIAILTTILIGLATTAQANDFLLHNETGHVLTSFITREKGQKWSANWIKTRGIKGGETWHMEFANPGKNCNVDVKVRSDDGYVHDYVIDFCKASEIFVTVDSIQYH